MSTDWLGVAPQVAQVAVLLLLGLGVVVHAALILLGVWLIANGRDLTPQTPLSGRVILWHGYYGVFFYGGAVGVLVVLQIGRLLVR